MQTLILLLIILSFISCNSIKIKKSDFSESDTSNWFSYKFCIENEAKTGYLIRKKIKKNKESDYTIVKGRIIDSEENLPFVQVYFKDGKTGIQNITSTDLDGSFEIKLEPGKYNLKAGLFPYDTLKLPNLLLKKMQIIDLTINMGTLPGFTTYHVQTKKALSKKELLKLEKKLSDK